MVHDSAGGKNQDIVLLPGSSVDIPESIAKRARVAVKTHELVKIPLGTPSSYCSRPIQRISAGLVSSGANQAQRDLCRMFSSRLVDR